MQTISFSYKPFVGSFMKLTIIMHVESLVQNLLFVVCTCYTMWLLFQVDFLYCECQELVQDSISELIAAIVMLAD